MTKKQYLKFSDQVKDCNNGLEKLVEFENSTDMTMLTYKQYDKHKSYCLDDENDFTTYNNQTELLEKTRTGKIPLMKVINKQNKLLNIKEEIKDKVMKENVLNQTI